MSGSRIWREATVVKCWEKSSLNEEPPARICLGGQRREMEQVEFDDLLSIVDEAEELARTRRALGNC